MTRTDRQAAAGRAAPSRAAADRATPDPSTATVPTATVPTAAGAGRHSSATTSRTARSVPRRARLQVRHINAWSVLKFSTLLAIALFLVWLIVVGVLYGALDSSGVIGKINDTVTTINGPGSTAPIATSVVFSGALVLGAVGAILFILLSTIGAVIYNLCADVVGGVEVTFAERD